MSGGICSGLGDAGTVNFAAVRQEAGDGQAVRGSFERQIVVGLRLRRDGFVKGVICPEVRITDIAGDAGKDVKRPVAGARLLMIETAAVAVGVQVCRQYEVDAQLVKERHKNLADVAETFLAFGTAFDAVLQDVFMNECNLPFGGAFLHVLLQPFDLLVQKSLLEVIRFIPLAVEHDEMDIAVIERIIIA